MSLLRWTSKLSKRARSGLSEMKDTSWRDQLCCVSCFGSLRETDGGLICQECSATFEVAESGVPFLMTPADRERFGVAVAGPGSAAMEEVYALRQRDGWASWAYRFLTPPEPVFVNPDAPPLPYAEDGLNLWLGGGGLDAWGHVNIDLAPFYGVDVVAHAGRLPFRENSCDRVACLALLEHVPDAAQIVEETLRVLRPGGQVQAVVPFCHPYHPYPSDFTRYSREGLERLFSEFDQVRVGIRTGPTTTILTFMTYFGKLLFPVHASNVVIRWFNRGVMGLWGWTTWPLVYLDRWINRLPAAHVLANHFYVTAEKPKR